MRKNLIALFLITAIACGVFAAPDPFMGFTITGYFQEAYRGSFERTKALIERYRGKNIVIGVLATFYYDRSTNSISTSKYSVPTTPNVKDVAVLGKTITDSSNRLGLMIYVDDQDKSEANNSSRAMIRIPFTSWNECLLKYFGDSALHPWIISISPELTESEKDSVGWESLISTLKNRFNGAYIAYAAHPSSPILQDRGQNPDYRWTKNLDYFGSTMIVGATSRSDLIVKNLAIIHSAVMAAKAHGVKPFIAEYGFPSHLNALDEPYKPHPSVKDPADGTVTLIGADQDIQERLLKETLPALSDIPFLLWGEETSAEDRFSAIDYSWEGKKAEAVIDSVLKLSLFPIQISPHLFDPDVPTSYWKQDGSRWWLTRPVGVVNGEIPADPDALTTDFLQNSRVRILEKTFPGHFHSILITGRGFSWATNGKLKGSMEVFCPTNKWVQMAQSIPLNANPLEETPLLFKIDGPITDPRIRFSIAAGEYATVIYDLNVELLK
jgi:hypothetical protein